MKPSLRTTLRACSLLPILALAAPSVRAQEAVAQALPTAREVVDRFAEVAKLRESLEKTRSMHARGTLSIPALGIQGKLETWSAKPSQNRMSMDMGPAGTMVAGCDGEVAWMTHPLMGARLLKDTELLQSRVEASWFAALKQGEAYESLRTVGREAFEGKECWKIEVVTRPLPGMDAEETRESRTTHEYYEIESGLLRGAKSRMEGELGTVASTTFHAEYRELGGRLLATRTIVRQTGQEIVLTVDSVELDTLGPEAFLPPPEVQALLAPAAPAAKPPQ